MNTSDNSTIEYDPDFDAKPANSPESDTQASASFNFWAQLSPVMAFYGGLIIAFLGMTAIGFFILLGVILL